MYTSRIFKIKRTFCSPKANFHLYLFDPPVLVRLVETEGGVEDLLYVGRAVTRLALLAGAGREAGQADRLGRHGAGQPAGGRPGPPHLHPLLCCCCCRQSRGTWSEAVEADRGRAEEPGREPDLLPVLRETVNKPNKQAQTKPIRTTKPFR